MGFTTTDYHTDYLTVLVTVAMQCVQNGQVDTSLKAVLNRRHEEGGRALTMPMTLRRLACEASPGLEDQSPVTMPRHRYRPRDLWRLLVGGNSRAGRLVVHLTTRYLTESRVGVIPSTLLY